LLTTGGAPIEIIKKIYRKLRKEGVILLKAYKYRIYPTKEQEEYFAKVFGGVRFIYNKML
jgi:hypothetical protein